ncbi:MAG: amino acid-binding protein [Deltaproteobacteria bacterium]|nr:amino acid-binding protein [Deltaproteobacteria bacterium]
MVIKQISVLLDNVPGALAHLVEALDKEDITPKAMLTASVADDSMVRLVVNEPERAAVVLESFRFRFDISTVLAVEVPIHPTGMNAILKPLAAGGINIHYLYTTINRLGEETIVILGVNNIERAELILRDNWIKILGEEVYSL